MPFLGDDVEGVRALSQSLDTLAADGVDPLLRSAELAKELPTRGAVSASPSSRTSPRPSRTRGVPWPTQPTKWRVSTAAGYAGSIRTRYDKYVDTVEGAESALGGAETAVGLLPDMLGGAGPRDYLMEFQNNAEIRASGGMPGSFARIHAENGRLTLVDQGTAAQFAERLLGRSCPSATRSGRSTANSFGTYFQDANFTPDFPRTAELMKARWEEESRADAASSTASYRSIRSPCPTSSRARARCRCRTRP